jgi:hypothetical protein
MITSMGALLLGFILALIYICYQWKKIDQLARENTELSLDLSLTTESLELVRLQFNQYVEKNPEKAQPKPETRRKSK